MRTTKRPTPKVGLLACSRLFLDACFGFFDEAKDSVELALKARRLDVAVVQEAIDGRARQRTTAELRSPCTADGAQDPIRPVVNGQNHGCRFHVPSPAFLPFVPAPWKRTHRIQCGLVPD